MRNNHTTINLPDPDLIVLFDGDCGICQALRRRVEARDAAHRLRFVAYQSAELDAIAPGVSRAMASDSVYAVRPDGHHWKGGRAVFEALRCLPGVWRWIGTVGALPPLSLLAEPFYRLVARRRTMISRWLGLSQCTLDTRFNKRVTDEQ